MASRTASKDIITLRGSAAIVSEFFGRSRSPLPFLLFFFALGSSHACARPIGV